MANTASSSRPNVRDVVAFTPEPSFGHLLESSLLKAGLSCRVVALDSVAELRARIQSGLVDAVVVQHRPPGVSVADTSYLDDFDGPVVGVVPPRWDGTPDERIDAVLVPGDLGRMAVRIAEIAERRRILADVRAANEARERAEHRLELVHGSSDTATIFVDAKGVVESLNDAARTLFDCPDDEHSGFKVQRLLPDLVIEQPEAGRPGESWLRKSRKRGAHRGAIALDVRGFPLPSTGGALLLIDDVPDLELAVRSARRRHDLLVDVLPGVTYILRLDAESGRPDRFLWMSPNTEQVLGEPADPFAKDGTHFLARIPDGERQLFESVMARGQERLGPQTVEHRFRTIDERTIWLRHYANPVADQRSGTQAMYGIMLDVSDEAQARNQMDLLARVVDQAPNVVIITNADGTIEYVNPAFEEVTGYTVGEAIGQNPRMLQSGRFGRDYYEQMWAELSAGRPWETLFENRRKDGSIYLQKSTISPVTDRHGTVRYVGIMQDVTHQSELEAETRQSKAWSDLGLLGAALAGDLDSALRTVVSALDQISAAEAPEVGRLAALDGLREAATTGLTLSERLVQASEAAKRGIARES